MKRKNQLTIRLSLLLIGRFLSHNHGQKLAVELVWTRLPCRCKPRRDALAGDG